MKRVAVLVSGGGTNLQALLESEARGENPNGKIVLVVASKPGVYALERAANFGVESAVVARKEYADSEAFDMALLQTLQSHRIDVVVLAGFLSVLGPPRHRGLPQPHPQCPSQSDSQLLRPRLLRPAGTRGGPGPGREGHRRHRPPGERGMRRRPHPAAESGGRSSPAIPRKCCRSGVMVEAEWKLLPQALAMVCNDEV